MRGGDISPRIDLDRTILLVIDVQESFREVIPCFDNVVNAISFLVSSLKKLGVPVVGTEQVPEKLGSTVEEIDRLLDYKFSKNTFDAFRDEEIRRRLLEISKEQLILTGIETHICVLQTALSALSLGFEVYLVYDATSSAFEEDKVVAVQRLAREGVKIVTSESIVYDILRSSKHPSFREIVKLVKEYRRKRLR